MHKIWWKYDQILWKFVKIWLNLMKILDLGSKTMISLSKKWFWLMTQFWAESFFVNKSFFENFNEGNCKILYSCSNSNLPVSEKKYADKNDLKYVFPLFGYDATQVII